MVSNIKPCCRRYLTHNEKFYVEIRNGSSEYLNAILFYTILDKEVTKPTPPFGSGKIERITFPGDAMAVFLQIFRTSFNPPALVCTKYIPSSMISRFKVEAAQGGTFVCIEV